MKRTIKVKGMSCQHCVNAVSKALAEIEGVTDVSVDLTAGEVHFQEATPVPGEVLGEKIRKAGFELG